MEKHPQFALVYPAARLAWRRWCYAIEVLEHRAILRRQPEPMH
jgi:hypothetical protein